MATILIPPDFKEFLKLLSLHKVDYLVVGGYAVNFCGHSRPTGDIDFWVRAEADNAERLTRCLRDFGFAQASADAFLNRGSVVRLGYPPLRIEILTGISGVEFAEAFPLRQVQVIDDVNVNFIDLEHLRQNKLAGRRKDLDDLDNLPPAPGAR